MVKWRMGFHQSNKIWKVGTQDVMYWTGMNIDSQVNTFRSLGRCYEMVQTEEQLIMDMNR